MAKGAPEPNCLRCEGTAFALRPLAGLPADLVCCASCGGVAGVVPSLNPLRFFAPRGSPEWVADEPSPTATGKPKRRR